MGYVVTQEVSAPLRYDAVRFVFEHSDEVAQLSLLQFLDLLETGKGKDLIRSLLEARMPSGGFPSSFHRETEGIRETCRKTHLLLKCGVPWDGLSVQAAMNFLLRSQREEGGWSENPALTLPENVVELSTVEPVTWLTADVVELLRAVDLGESPSCVKALNWLRGMQSHVGGWPMYGNDSFIVDPDSTAQILFMFKEIYGEEDLAYVKGIRFFEKCLDAVAVDAERGYHVEPNGKRVENDVYHLTHLLLSSLVDTERRLQAGYDLRDERVRKIVQAILENQREDGGWRPFWTACSSPTYTVLTLKLLTWLGVLNTGELREQASKYV